MSSRIAKYFVYKKLFNNLNFIIKKYKKEQISLNDFACGDGNILNYYKFNKYVGIDLNRSKIKNLKATYPDANCFFACKDITRYFSKSKNLITICMETFGINTKFHKSFFIKTIKNMIRSTKKNGYLLFNVEKSFNNEYLFTILKKNFYKIKITNYGFFDHRLPFFLVRLFWRLEFIFFSNKYAFFFCKSKIK